MKNLQIWIGMMLIVIGIVGFFVSMNSLDLFGTKIIYDKFYILKTITALFFLVFSMYGSGYILGGNKTGLLWAKWCGLILVSSELVGYLGSKYTPSLQKFFPTLIFFLLIFYAGYRQNRNIKQGFKVVSLMLVGIVAIILIIMGLQLFGCYLGGSMSSCDLSI